MSTMQGSSPLDWPALLEAQSFPAESMEAGGIPAQLVRVTEVMA